MKDKRSKKLMTEPALKDIPTDLVTLRENKKTKKSLKKFSFQQESSTLFPNLSPRDSNISTISKTGQKGSTAPSNLSKISITFHPETIPEEIINIAETEAGELLQEFWEEAWEICLERFLNKNAHTCACVDLRDTWLRVVEKEWMDLEMVRSHQHADVKVIFSNPNDEPPRPLAYDSWSRGALVELPRNRRESVLDPFLRRYSSVTVPKDIAVGVETWVNGNVLLGLKGKGLSSKSQEMFGEDGDKYSRKVKSVAPTKTKKGKSNKSKTKGKKSKGKKLGKSDSKVREISPPLKLALSRSSSKTLQVKIDKRNSQSKPTKGKSKVKVTSSKSSTKTTKGKTTKSKGKKKNLKKKITQMAEEITAPANSFVSLVSEEAPVRVESIAQEEEEEEEEMIATVDEGTQTEVPETYKKSMSNKRSSLEEKRSILSINKRFETLRERPHLERNSSLDMSMNYKIAGTIPWVPQDCGAWTGEGVYRLPRQTTSEAINETHDQKEDTVRLGSIVEETENDYDPPFESNRESSNSGSQTSGVLSNLSFQQESSISIRVSKNKLTPSENDFFNRKMEAFRVKLTKTEAEQRKQSNYVAGISKFGGGDDLSKISSSHSQNLLQKRMSKKSSKIPISILHTSSNSRHSEIKHSTLFQSDSLPSQIIEVSKNLEKEVIEEVIEEELFIARLAAKGIKIPEFPSESDIQRRKKMLDQHTEFASERQKKKKTEVMIEESLPLRKSNYDRTKAA